MFEHDTVYVTTMLFNTLLQPRLKGCHNTVQHLFRNPLNTLQNLLLYVVNIGRLCYVYFVFKVVPEEVVWHCKVRRAGGPGDVPETRNESAWKHCAEDLHRNLCCVSSCSILLESQQIFPRGWNSLRKNVPGTTLYLSAFTVTVGPSEFSKK
jgi:hypothetical protein